jgi:ketosteroid isomerase-like protein
MHSSPEILQLVADWFAAGSRGDPTIVNERVAAFDGTRLIGSDPGEWFQGGDAVDAFLRGEVEGAGGNATFTTSEGEAYEHGDTGWAATKLTITLPDGAHITPRWSAVFVKVDGTWQFVQIHASIPVGNDEIGWTYA